MGLGCRAYLEREEDHSGFHGNGSYLDIRYEDWTGRDIDAPVRVIREMAQELKWEYTEDALRAAAMRRLSWRHQRTILF